MSGFSLNSYQVGILCALPLEKAAVEATLDEEHDRPEGIPIKDEHSYTFGRIGHHHVVIACLPDGITGKKSAATMGTDVTRTFPIKIGLMVGIGGGAPSRNNDIRLGDIVVGRPQGIHGGVVQYDFGKELPNGFSRTGMLNKPPTALLSALSSLRAKHERPNWNRLTEHLANIAEEMGEKYQFQGEENDILFESTYEHVGGPETACDEKDTPRHCDLNRIVPRQERKDPSRPVIHYGNIASADKVMRQGTERDRIAEELGVICFDMEAAGLEDNFRCIVVRGISDYSDSHKNKRWQRYAASTAAAFAKEFLGFVLPQGLDELMPARETKATISSAQGSKAKVALPAISNLVRFSPKGMPMIDDFVSRDDEMNQLRSYLLSKGPQSLKTLVIHGMGGIGKTQLCVEFARQHKSHFDSIFWIDGSSRASLQQSLSEAASRALGIMVKRDFAVAKSQAWPFSAREGNADDISRQFLAWLSEDSNDNWLLIFDNVDRDWTRGVDKDAFDLKSYLPDCDHGNVLVTTRLSHLLPSKKRLHLDTVTNEQARRILETRAGKSLPDAQRLIDRLGGLPLALAQAGCYLRQPLTVEKYLEFYEETWTRLMKSQQKFPRAGYLERSLLTTWILSYEQVFKESPAAAGALRLWAFFHSNDLWFDLLAVPSAGNPGRQWPTWYSTLVDDELAFHDSMNILLAYSLASISANGQGYSMQRVVHDWCRHQIGTAHERSQLSQMAIQLIGTCGDGADIDLERRLLPHARHQAKCIQPDGDEHTIASLKAIADMLGAWAEWTMAAKLYEHVRSFYQIRLGPDHERTLRTTESSADVHAKAGLVTQSSALYDRALEGYRIRYGRKSAEALSVLHRRAVLERDHGTIEVAREMFEETLQGYKETYGVNHEKTYLTAYDMARTLQPTKSSQAIQLLHLSLQGKRNCLGKTHWMTAETSYQLGITYIRLKAYGIAEISWHTALLHIEPDENRQKWMETTYMIPTLWALSKMYIQHERVLEAERTLLRLRKAISLRYEQRHPAMYAAMQLASWTSRRLVRLAKAKRTITALLDIVKDTAGADAEDAYELHTQLAQVLLRMGKLKEARHSLERAAEVSDRNTDDAQRHVQHSIDYCQNRCISECELQAVLADMRFPAHSDITIQSRLADIVAERAAGKKSKDLDPSTEPIATNRAADSCGVGMPRRSHSPSASVNSESHHGHVSFASPDESSQNVTETSRSSPYCTEADKCFCDMFPPVSEYLQARDLVKRWDHWVKKWAPELRFSSWKRSRPWRRDGSDCRRLNSNGQGRMHDDDASSGDSDDDSGDHCKISKRMARREVITELGYPFDESEQSFFVRVPLQKEHIDEIIELSKNSAGDFES